MNQTQKKPIGLTLLLLTLLLNSISENLWAQIETPNSGRPHRPPRQADSGRRTARGARAPAQAEISTGFVFLNGQYRCPPYTIALAGSEVSLNGVKLPTLSLARSNQRPHSQGRGGRVPSHRQVAWLKQELSQDAVLIHLDENTMALIPGYQALTVFDTLLSSQSSEEKVRSLAEEELMEFSSIQWASLVDGFEVSPELLDRVAILRETLAQQQELGEQMPWYLGGSFPIMPILGFVLAVLALGTLLSCRPPAAFSRVRPRHLKMYCRQVCVLVGLIVVLNLYDLACTLYARGIGGFWEMNPFAGYILDVPAMVICFKLGLTVGPAILLILARHRKLAQMASWWGGVLYTVLILRWVTYNAMFMH